MRANTRWTEQEQAVVAEAVASGNTHVRNLLPLLPGRTKQHVWNMVQCAKREAAGKCMCGAPLPDRTARHSRCQACLDTARVRADARKAAGMCMRCTSRPADATLTYCSMCHQKARDETLAKRGPTSLTHTTASGLVRWRAGARPNRVIPHLLDEGWLLVDLFGGAANIATAVATCQKSRRVVYNDIHPTLCDVIEVVRTGQVKDLVALCDLFQNMTPEELLLRYRHRADQPPLVRAALLVMLAQSVKDRDFFKMEVPEVLPLPAKSYMKRVHRLVPALSRIEVLNRDFAGVIAEYDSPRTLFFVDPPYPGTQFYEHNLSDERFAELCGQLNNIQGRFFMLSNSTRTSAEMCHTLPYNWWLLSHHGFTHNRLLVSTNYVVELPPVDLALFGIGKQRFDAAPPNRAETPHFPPSILL